MNFITKLVFLLSLWGIMGFGFLVKFSEVKRKNEDTRNALKSTEGILFFASIGLPVLYAVYYLLTCW